MNATEAATGLLVQEAWLEQGLPGSGNAQIQR